MSRLVSRRPARARRRTVIPRWTPRGHEHFIGRLDNLLERSHLVLISRCHCAFLSIVKNGARYLVRDELDSSIGTFETLSAAVAGLDAYDKDDCQQDDNTGNAA